MVVGGGERENVIEDTALLFLFQIDFVIYFDSRSVVYR